MLLYYTPSVPQSKTLKKTFRQSQKRTIDMSAPASSVILQAMPSRSENASFKAYTSEKIQNRGVVCRLLAPHLASPQVADLLNQICSPHPDLLAQVLVWCCLAQVLPSWSGRPSSGAPIGAASHRTWSGAAQEIWEETNER